jgi:hypothetical protein
MSIYQLIGIIVIVAFVGLVIFFRTRIRGGASFRLRPIPAYDLIKRQAGQAVETGQRLHLSMGTGGIGGPDTIVSLAALPILGVLADPVAIQDAPPIVTVADPTLLPVTLDAIRRAERSGRVSEPRYDAAMLVAPRPLAYAAGAGTIVRDQKPTASVAIGVFGPEVALLMHAGEEAGVMQMAGTADPLGQAVMTVTAGAATIVGEEIFAGGAYLCNEPNHVASLMTQDAWRVILIGVMLVGVVLRTLGVF